MPAGEAGRQACWSLPGDDPSGVFRGAHRRLLPPTIEAMLAPGSARQLRVRTLLAGMCLALADGRPFSPDPGVNMR